MSKEFEAYPIRQIRMSDDVWEALKKEKEKSGKTWHGFIKQLMEAEEK